MMPIDPSKTRAASRNGDAAGCAFTTLRENYTLALASSSNVAAFLMA